MAEAITVARPYAQALFQIAQQRSQLSAWSDKLVLLATVVGDTRMIASIKNPTVDRDIITQTIFTVVDQQLGSESGQLEQDLKNFICLLADNDRLTLFGDIVEVYEQLRADTEKLIKAEVIAAYAVDEAQQTQIAAALKARLGREVELTCRVDESLLGSAVIRAGDLVIDGSVATKLEQLERELIH